MPTKKQVKLTKSGKPDMRGKHPNSQRALKKGQELIKKSFRRTFGVEDSGDEDETSESETEYEQEPEQVVKKKHKPKRQYVYEEESDTESEPEVVVIKKKKKKSKVKEIEPEQPVAVAQPVIDYAKQLEEAKLKHQVEIEMLRKEKEVAITNARMGRIHQIKNGILTRF